MSKCKHGAFLWKETDESAARTKVAWELVFVPKRDGGLGLRRISEWNKVVIMNHSWNLFAKLDLSGLLGCMNTC